MSASDIPDQVKERLAFVAEVSKNARTTWFALIGVLLFSTIAIGGVEDRDFFSYDSSVQLPLVAVSVPVLGFFYAGPVIVLGLYTYFHLYLIKLWRALSWVGPEAAPGLQLDDVAYPWLISDAAIQRKPGAERRSLGWLTQTVSLAMGWWAGPVVLALFWYRSFPPHNLFLTLWCGALMAAAVTGGVLSYRLWVRTMQLHPAETQPTLHDCAPTELSMGVGTLALLLSILATQGGVLTWTDNGKDIFLYPANLYRAELAERPDNWLPHDEAQAEFMAKYSGLKRRELDLSAESQQPWTAAAKTAFKSQREGQLASLRAKDFPDVNFRAATLSEAFMPGLDLRRANLRFASLVMAQMEGTLLFDARLDRANFRDARMESANLVGASMREAYFAGATLTGADFREARLDGASFHQARMDGADFSKAQMEGANFFQTRLDRASFRGAGLAEANFLGAHMQGGDLVEVWAVGATLSHAKISDANFHGANLRAADVSGADMSGSGLTAVDLRGSNITQEQLDSAFGDASTAGRLPSGLTAPDHWSKGDLSAIWTIRFEQWCAWRAARGHGPSRFCPEN